MGLMPKNGPCVLVPNQISETVWGDVEKDSFIALPGNGGHSSLLPQKWCVPTHEAPILWPPDVKSQLIREDLDAGKD